MKLQELFRGRGYCSSLMTINCHNPEPPELGDVPVFRGVPDIADVYVPNQSSQIYINTPGWDYFHNYHDVAEWDSITDVVADEDAADAPVYNTLGVRVDDSYKGLLIKNGKSTYSTKIVNSTKYEGVSKFRYTLIRKC